MKILLISPPISTVYGKPRFPPLGLSYLASILLKNGHEVMAIDMRLKEYDYGYLRKTIQEFEPDLVGIGSTSFGFKESISVFKEIKNVSKDIITVLGGPHVAIAYEKILQNKEIDFLIIGEGEITFLELVTKLENKENINNLNGLIFNKDDKVHINEHRQPVNNLDELPLPEFNLFPLKKYKVNGKLILPIMTSRGCPYSCIYCSIHKTLGKKYRARDPIKCVEEIEYNIKKYNCRDYTIVDDNFNLDLNRAVKFCEEIIRRNLNIKWSCDQGMRADRTNRELFRLMKKSGCDMIAIGVESANQKILDKLKKGEKLLDIENAIKNAKSENMTVKAFFLIGSPGETKEDVKESIEFFKRLDIDIPRFNMLVCYPGTELEEYVKENSQVLFDIDDYITNYTHTGNVEVLYETPEFTKKERIEMYNLAEKEAEKWIIGKKLKKIFGPLSKPISPVFTNTISRNLVKMLYRLKLISIK